MLPAEAESALTAEAGRFLTSVDTCDTCASTSAHSASSFVSRLTSAGTTDSESMEVANTSAAMHS